MGWNLAYHKLIKFTTMMSLVVNNRSFSSQSALTSRTGPHSRVRMGKGNTDRDRARLTYSGNSYKVRLISSHCLVRAHIGLHVGLGPHPRLHRMADSNSIRVTSLRPFKDYLLAVSEIHMWSVGVLSCIRSVALSLHSCRAHDRSSAHGVVLRIRSHRRRSSSAADAEE
jgi:hypothetical protein